MNRWLGGLIKLRRGPRARTDADYCVMNILLVEDQDDSRKTLSRLIGMRGHKVTQVATAEEAERALATESFPFLILDWMLPGKSGIDLCRE